MDTNEKPVGDALHHEGTTCPFCGITTVCGHPVKIPNLPPWQSAATTVRFTTP